MPLSCSRAAQASYMYPAWIWVCGWVGRGVSTARGRPRRPKSCAMTSSCGITAVRTLARLSRQASRAVQIALAACASDARGKWGGWVDAQQCSSHCCPPRRPAQCRPRHLHRRSQQLLTPPSPPRRPPSPQPPQRLSCFAPSAGLSSLRSDPFSARARGEEGNASQRRKENLRWQVCRVRSVARCGLHGEPRES